MRSSKIKSKLSRNEPALGVTLHLTDPSVFELAGLLGFDGIWMDLEHHGYSVETAGQLMRAARVGGADIVARPGKGEFMRIGRLLELGAQAIMYPRCDDPQEARARWCAGRSSRPSANGVSTALVPTMLTSRRRLSTTCRTPTVRPW